MAPPTKPKNPPGVIKIDFAYQEAQKKLLTYVTRNGGTYLELKAKQNLEVGGQRGGKTLSKLMHGVMDYCLRFPKCDILVLRRTVPELDQGAIRDFKTFVPGENEVYTFNHTTRVATFVHNGSRVVFAGCATNVERDIEKYLGQAYPYILVDECAQFSPDVWERLYLRNLVNAACEPDEHGNLPTPRIVGCTNPIGQWWEYYHTVFVKGEPWIKEEGAKEDKHGRWFVPEVGGWRCVYNPSDYAFNHSTVLDNPAYQKRDPGLVARLRSMPKAKMEKFLLGLMDSREGQYFDCFSEEHHVIDLRADPDAIIWQDWQPVWGGQDWGVGHWNAFYLFTKAMVKKPFKAPDEPDDYISKIVCFKEVAPETTGQTNVDFADLISAAAYYPRLPQTARQYETISAKRCKVNTIYFSHEKFSRVMEAHSPADEYSRLLRERGLPPVSRGTMDRIGSAGYMYNLFKTGKIVILKTCPGIIKSLPNLQRDPKELDDVQKTNSKADDRYDAFRLGVYGEFKSRATPEAEMLKAKMKGLDPFAAHFVRLKASYELKHSKDQFKQPEVPFWQTKLQ